MFSYRGVVVVVDIRLVGPTRVSDGIWVPGWQYYAVAVVVVLMIVFKNAFSGYNSS